MDSTTLSFILAELRQMNTFLQILAEESRARTQLLHESVSLQTDSTTCTLETNARLLRAIGKDELYG